MRIVALYDIHGNPDALDAVLRDPAAAGVDAIVVGGDVVPGPEAAAVLARLEEVDVPLRWLRGNGEREVAAALDAGSPDPDDVPLATAVLTAQEVGAGTAKRLGALPTTVELDGVLFCHATPRSDEELLTRDSGPERYADALAGVQSALVVAGHTHQQDDRRVGDVRFVNAGSVGLPYEGDGAARWLLVADGEPELRQTTYDARAAGERFLAAGWPDPASVGAALIDPVAPQVITDVFERRSGSA